LNVFQRYRQACAVLKRTSRASNAAWYQDALDLEHQLHIRFDGTSVVTRFFQLSTREWSAGPALAEGVLRDAEAATDFANDLLAAARSRGARAIGLILHLADEFATAELDPELDNPASLPELRATAAEDPKSILDDSTVDATQSSWRVVPYPAEGSESIATTVTVSRHFAPFFDAVRAVGEARNFPIMTHALSAPLVALTALEVLATPGEGKPFVGILQYPGFTAMGFFNPHGDLKLVRTLQHRGSRRPANFRHALGTTTISLEFLDPDVFLLPLGSEVDSELAADLRQVMPDSRVEVIAPPADLGDLPGWCLEPWLSVAPPPAAESARSTSFVMLRDEKWAFQDFLDIPRETAELYPSRAEMRMLKAARLARVALVLLSLAGIGWLGFGLLQVIRQPEWAFNPAEAQTIQMRMASLNLERSRAEHWHNLLADRSKAWIAMESLARMFPENSGVKIRTYQHNVKPETTQGQATAGFVREWRITGLARDEALERLNQLNTREGIAAHFDDIARITGNVSYEADSGTRSIVVNVRTMENSGFRGVTAEDYAAGADNTYPFTFDLVISQRFESSDPLALKVAAAP
jgi:hypothetical protein